MSKIMEQYVVKIGGIQSRPELNGQVGNLTGEPTGYGRYSVRLGAGSVISLKWSSLELTNPKKHECVERRVSSLPYVAGLYAKQDIPKGSLIYTEGEPPLQVRKENDLRQLWRFSTNHSCSHIIISTPRYSDKSELVFALRDIKAGEELVRSYSGACVWTPKKQRPAVIQAGYPYEKFDCLCTACSIDDSIDDDKLRVETKKLAGIVYTMTADRSISCEMWCGAIKPFLMLEDTNPVKVVVGLSTYRGLYPGLFHHMKQRDFVGRSDSDFDKLFEQVKNMCLYLHIMFGFPNNFLITDSPAGQPIHVANIDQAIGQYIQC